jgi:hypothetical protein
VEIRIVMAGGVRVRTKTAIVIDAVLMNGGRASRTE